jgi:hypothetical protein
VADDVVGIELQANWVDLTVSGGERGRKPLASAEAANNCGEQYYKRRCASSPVLRFTTFTGWLAPIPLELHVTCGGFQQCTCIETKPTYTTFP